MRLPWLQIDTNVFPRLDSLAGLLKISQAHAYGLAAALWAWAIDWGPSDRPPTGEVVSPRAGEIVSAGLRWEGDPDVLIGALRDIGLVADIEGGLRIKGMSRYAEAWKRQDKSKTKAAKWRDQKRKWRAENEGRTTDKPRTSAGQTSKTETETETHTEKTKSIAGKKPPADPRLLPLTTVLVADYAAIRFGTYKHGGAKDALALKALLPIATDDEIRARWRQGLRATGWASCSTFAQLGSKWNDLGAPVPTRAGGLTLPVVPSEQGHTTRDLTETF